LAQVNLNIITVASGLRVKVRRSTWETAQKLLIHSWGLCRGFNSLCALQNLLIDDIFDNLGQMDDYGQMFVIVHPQHKATHSGTTSIMLAACAV